MVVYISIIRPPGWYNVREWYEIWGVLCSAIYGVIHRLFHQTLRRSNACLPSPLMLVKHFVVLPLRTKTHIGPYLLLRHGGGREGRLHRGHAVRGRSGQVFRGHPQTDAAIPRGEAREAAGRNSGVLWTRSESNRVYEHVFLKIKHKPPPLAPLDKCRVK